MGRDATGILQGLRDGELRALVILGTDPVRDHPDPRLARDALENAEFVVAFDLFLSDSAALADVVLPVEGFGEVEGTVTNLEGRVQKVNRLLPGPGQTRVVWSALDDLSVRMGGVLGATSATALLEEIRAVAPAYGGVSWDLLDWGGGREGVVLPTPEGHQPLEYIPVDPGLPPGPDGWGLHLARVLYDDGVLTRMSPSLAALAPEGRAYLHPADVAAASLHPGSTVTVAGEAGSVDLPLGIDGGLVPGTVYVPANLAATAGLGATPVVTVTAAGGEA
jgi:predicted molibdopterin-dependent oxidoreductase YjgC